MNTINLKIGSFKGSVRMVNNAFLNGCVAPSLVLQAGTLQKHDK